MQSAPLDGEHGGAVGGKSLEGAKYGVCLRRLGLAGLGELRGLERRSTLEGSRSRESREGVRSTAKCAGNAQLESLGVAQEKTQDTGNAAGHTLRLRWGWKRLLIFCVEKAYIVNQV